MIKLAESDPIDFVVNTGDNFYYCGIQNSSDFQVQVDFLEPYASNALDVPWYSILGNHEYGYNVDAQLELAKLHRKWIMDARYYTKRVKVKSDLYISFIMLDTSPCIKEYRSTNANYWDPCGSEFPTCSPVSEGTCEFHANIISQSCDDQFTWFKQALKEVPQDDWLIIVGHHPADEINVQDFTSAMQDRGFHLYLNGHAHTLTHYSVDDNAAYVTSGAGSMVRTQDQHHPTTRLKVQGGSRPANASLGVKDHSYTTVWNQKVAGFTRHKFSSDFSELITDFISYEGEVLHSFTVSKTSPPRPSPGSLCCHYSDPTCKVGDVCCRSQCSDVTKCSYTKDACEESYGKHHHCAWNGTQCLVGTSSVAPSRTAQVA